MTNPQQSQQYLASYQGGNMQGNSGAGRGQVNGANQANQQMNGAAGGLPQAGALGQGRGYPDLGLQMDMNVLWEYIQNLSDLHAGIRAQTQQVLSGVQEVQRRGINSSTPETHPFSDTNGVDEAAAGSTAPNPAAAQRSQAQDAEISALRDQLDKTESDLSETQASNHSLVQLLSDYEAAITYSISKLRPFAQQHATALNAQKAHYLQLLEEERKQNLELRMEQQGWQEKLGGVVGMLREAVKIQGLGEGPWRARIKELKAENESLRRIMGIEVDDSDEDDGPAVTDIAMSAMAPNTG